MEPMALKACADSPLTLWERAGVRARFATKPPVEKAAPFSTLRHCWASTAEPSQPNLHFVWIAPSPRGRGLG